MTISEDVPVSCFRYEQVRSPIEDRGEHASMRRLEVLDEHQRRGEVSGELRYDLDERVQASRRRRQTDDTLSLLLAHLSHPADRPDDGCLNAGSAAAAEVSAAHAVTTGSRRDMKPSPFLLATTTRIAP